MKKAAMKLRGTLDREATDQELADDLDLSLRCIRQYREASRPLIQLDSTINSDDPTPLSETIADENAAAPFDELVRDSDYHMVDEILATLDARRARFWRCASD